MAFLNERDYLKTIQRRSLIALMDGDASIRIAAEEAAIQEFAGYLSQQRFDVAAIFREIDGYDGLATYMAEDTVYFVPPAWAAQAYAPGDQVSFDLADGTWIVEATAATLPTQTPASAPLLWARSERLASGIWQAAAPNGPGSTPRGGGGDWNQRDPRHRLVVMYLVDIALWHIYSRTDPSAISDMRRTRYEQALAWLGLVSKGMIADPWLPLVSDPETEPQGNFYMSSQPPGDFTL